MLPAVELKDLASFAGRLSVTHGRLSSGLYLEGLLVLTEREIFGEATSTASRAVKGGNLLASLDDIVPGDFVCTAIMASVSSPGSREGRAVNRTGTDAD